MFQERIGLQRNRVTPTGEIVAEPKRGTLMGNRARLHGADGRLGRARWRGHAWISCTLDPADGALRVKSPGSPTDLFFHDEAVALAAGHRPCCLCRRDAARAFRAAWDAAMGPVPRIAAIDASLHAARIWPGTRMQKRCSVDIRDLPDGAFFLWEGRAHLVHDGLVRPYGPAGYSAPVRRPQEPVMALTPAPMLKVLSEGYRPILAIDAPRDV